MKTFILEDNLTSRELFKQYIREDNPELVLIGEAPNLREARAFLEHQSPDLVLFDIDLPDGTSFDLLQYLHEREMLNFDIIFITAFGTQEYLVRALDFSALKYLSKPLNRRELREAVLKALERRSNRELFVRQINMLLENSKNAQVSTGVIALPLVKGVIEMVELEDIVYISSVKGGNVTQVQLRGNQSPLSCSRTIGQFKNLLTFNNTFFQVHESYIVNLKALKRFDPVERIVTMKDGAKIVASRRYAKSLKDYLLKEQANDEVPDTGGMRYWLSRFLGKRV